MRNLYVVEFEHQLEVMDQDMFNHFLSVCVMQNKDITTFSVTNLATHPVDIDKIVQIVNSASVKGIILCGGAFVFKKNSNKQYLYED